MFRLSVTMVGVDPITSAPRRSLTRPFLVVWLTLFFRDTTGA